MLCPVKGMGFSSETIRHRPGILNLFCNSDGSWEKFVRPDRHGKVTAKARVSSGGHCIRCYR